MRLVSYRTLALLLLLCVLAVLLYAAVGGLKVNIHKLTIYYLLHTCKLMLIHLCHVHLHIYMLCWLLRKIIYLNFSDNIRNIVSVIIIVLFKSHMLVCTRIVEIILGYRPFGIDPKFDCTLIRLGQSKLPHWLTLRFVRYSPFQIG